MGVNKWRFARQLAPARDLSGVKFYLQPDGGLGTNAPDGGSDTFTQPAPYIDPKVYCLRYTTAPFEQDTEVIGNLALHLDAAAGH